MIIYAVFGRKKQWPDSAQQFSVAKYICVLQPNWAYADLLYIILQCVM